MVSPLVAAFFAAVMVRYGRLDWPRTAVELFPLLATNNVFVKKPVTAFVFGAFVVGLTPSGVRMPGAFVVAPLATIAASKKRVIRVFIYSDFGAATGTVLRLT